MADDKDFHNATWERGLIRRKNSYRYRRTVKGKRFCEIWGEIGLTEAPRRAQRLNLDIDDAIQHGRSLSRIIQGSKSKPVTFERFATDVWLPTKAASIQPTSVKRLRVPSFSLP